MKCVPVWKGKEFSCSYHHTSPPWIMLLCEPAVCSLIKLSFRWLKDAAWIMGRNIPYLLLTQDYNYVFIRNLLFLLQDSVGFWAELQLIWNNCELNFDKSSSNQTQSTPLVIFISATFSQHCRKQMILLLCVCVTTGSFMFFVELRLSELHFVCSPVGRSLTCSFFHYITYSPFTHLYL